MKRLLIDLSILRHPYCGLGQIALNYGRWYAQHADELPAEVTLLVPKAFMGAFGQRVRYLEAKDCYRFMPWLMPRYDIWQSIHQLSSFRPMAYDTFRLVTIHDVNFIYEKQGRKRERYRRRLQEECDRADCLLFISHFVEEDTRRHIDFKGKETHVIYNGVEDMREGPQQRPSTVDATKPFLLNIGVVKPKKNNHVLLPMMDLMPDYQLVIAGDDRGAYARHLREQLPQHANVRMLGTVDDTQRRWLYAHCAALVMPSLYEGFGLPVIEAMQWGKPVICSRMTSLPEIGGSHAFYFPSFEPEAMAQAVRTSMSQTDIVRSLEEQQYAVSFNYSRHLEEYWKIISKIICPCNK
ncbi:MAG: glycosyltransferase family 4 protein [Bacteroidales bacterium]|nr:glycosyltransferase family 4 protein [Bacteroidales bacterium]MBR3411973.1 glycosyltransferase family 4 protein [Bacteroidales bacterium]